MFGAYLPSPPPYFKCLSQPLKSHRLPPIIPILICHHLMKHCHHNFDKLIIIVQNNHANTAWYQHVHSTRFHARHQPFQLQSAISLYNFALATLITLSTHQQLDAGPLTPILEIVNVPQLSKF